MALIDFSLSDAGSLIKDIRESITGKAIEDPTKRAELEIKLKELENELVKGQMAINKVEAASRSLFVSGARPFVIWIGGFALAYEFIAAPFLHSLFNVYGYDFPLPELDSGTLMALVSALLGIGGLRTYEKAKGIHNNIAE
jgi:hypothetical protein